MAVILISSMVSNGSRSPGSRRLGFAVAALLAAAVAGCAPPSGSSVFKEAVTDEIPRSVAILNYYVPRDLSLFQPPIYWVQFTVSQDDLKNIISTGGFVKGPGYALEFDHLNPPQWWSPGDLGEDLFVYERKEHPLDPENSNWSKVMFINSDMTEVYCNKLVYW